MAFQFKIQLEDVEDPEVWRRVIVPETFTFHRFHTVIQEAFGWGDYHLYQFSTKGYKSKEFITVPHEGYDDDIIDSEEITLQDVFSRKGQTYIYIYDFGDDWTHKIKLEKITPEKPLHASCVDGQGACPPEDCGGAWGYDNLRMQLKKANEQELNESDKEEIEELKDWLGLDADEDWDANAFDLASTNAMVKLV